LNIFLGRSVFSGKRRAAGQPQGLGPSSVRFIPPPSHRAAVDSIGALLAAPQLAIIVRFLAGKRMENAKSPATPALRSIGVSTALLSTNNNLFTIADL
jgi:hypothetical protein